MAVTRAQTRANPNNHQPPALVQSRATPTLSSPPKPSLEPQTRVASVSRKRQREDLNASEQPEHRALKRARPSNRTPQSRDNGETDETDPIAYWVTKGRWPARHKHMERVLARKKSKTSLSSRKRSEPNSASSPIPHDQRLREEKCAPYCNPRYKTLLETKGSFMDKSVLGITDESKTLCRTLLEKEQQTPKDSLFRDDIFEVTWLSIRTSCTHMHV
ncbi:hypothetical protein FNYG_09791 [Fusarium nygamai]|uniref:Uncharacterized protein n=1 Tax=Gibberella nygamai TaxID=42673 RepID=A0A2K0W3S2_GIBNY|nr:hypothetical protein FNYG_09791 [Fusarium nygamai]